MFTRCTSPVLISLFLLAPAALAKPSPRRASDKLTTAAAAALTHGDPTQALVYANGAISIDPGDPWAHYDKGAANNALGNTDAAIEGFSTAEALFGVDNTWGRSLAIYGRARARELAGSCDQARADYLEYAKLVRANKPSAARLALEKGKECKEKTASPPTIVSASAVESATVAAPMGDAVGAAPEAGIVTPAPAAATPAPAAVTAARVDYREALIRFERAPSTAALAPLLDALCAAIESAPSANAAMLAPDLDQARALAGQIGAAPEREQTALTKRALASASNALVIVARNVDIYGDGAAAEAEALRREVTRIDERSTSPADAGTAITSAFDHAQRTLQALQQIALK